MEDAAGEPITTSNNEHTSSLLVTTMSQHFKPNTQHTHIFLVFLVSVLFFFFFADTKACVEKDATPHTLHSVLVSILIQSRTQRPITQTHTRVRAHTDTRTVLSCEAAALEHAQQVAPRLTKYDTAFFFALSSVRFM